MPTNGTGNNSNNKACKKKLVTVAQEMKILADLKTKEEGYDTLITEKIKWDLIWERGEEIVYGARKGIYPEERTPFKV